MPHPGEGDQVAVGAGGEVGEGATVTPAELREFLAEKFAKWQLPEAFAFIDEVPRTSVGKFDMKVLRKWYADRQIDVQS